MSSSQEPAFTWVSHAIAVREQLIAQVRAGELSLDQAFSQAESDPLVGRIFAVKILEAVPGIGKVRSRRTMARLGLDDAATMVEVPPATQIDIGVAFAAE